ncbi:MAG TPA: GAF domain-containing protein [Kofleriaceae bacterium]|nr:GAF domain-containing protein [Kofleriaceae bacterium]
MNTTIGTSRPAPAEPAHIVQFYETDEYLAGVVSQFLAEGFEAGAGGIIIAVEAHRASILTALRSRNVDVDALSLSGRLQVLDAHETLGRILRRGVPDRRLFLEVLDRALQAATSRAPSPAVRAYGEMVDVLWRQGNPSAAIHLEELWNDAQRTRPFSLLCAYVTSSFSEETSKIHHVCATHNEVRPPEPRASDSPSQGITLEIAHRSQIERALRTCLRELREKEAELSDFVENATVGLHRVGPDGTILWANPAELQMLGYAADEYIGQPITKFHVDADVIADILARLHQGEILHNRAARMRAKDGSVRHVLIDSSAYREDGAFVHSRCFMRDVTEEVTTSRRSEQLLEVTAAIADAVTSQEVFAAIVDRIGEAIDASSVGLFLLDPDGNTIRLARSVGYHDDAKPHLLVTTLDGELRIPAADCIRCTDAIWINSRDELVEQYPHLANVTTPGRNYRIACLPLVVRGRAVGSIGLTFDDVDPLGDRERDFLRLVARYSAQAIERLRLVDAERSARARAEAAAERTRILSDAAHAFTEAGVNIAGVLSTMASNLIDGHADSAAVFTMSEAGDTLEVATAQHRDPVQTAAIRATLAAYPVRVGEGLLGGAVAAGEPLFLRSIDREQMLAAADPRYRAHLERHHPTSMAIVPLRARGQTLGVVTASREPPSPSFTDEDFALVQGMAERAALAMDNARLHRADQEARARAELLYRLAREVIAAEGVEAVFRAALDAIRQALGTDRSAVLTYGREERMRFRAWRGLSAEYREAVDGHSPWARSERDVRPFMVPDVRDEESMRQFAPAFQTEGIGALAFFPLSIGHQLLGKLMVYFDRPRAMNATEVELVRAIADHVAVAVVRFTADDELRNTVRFNELFAGVLGHDLRNPLSAIMTASQLAMMHTPGDKVMKPLTRIVSSSERMRRMIEQLLDFTRVRVGQGIPLDRQLIDLAHPVRQVMDELEDAHPERKLTLQVHGDVTGRWDADRLGQVFSNLVANAIQHGHGQEVGVRLEGHAGNVYVEIHNEGLIPEDVLPSIFEPMSGRPTRRTGSRGLGLGLYISREIVSAHGGAVTVSSDSQRGTTFQFQLPRD